jgi:hypothetical protein
MGMSTHVYGVIPADTKYKKMAEIYKQCSELHVTVPAEVLKFFNHEPPDDKGVLIPLEKLECCDKYNEDMREGYEIEIARLPLDVKYVRFVNSY